MGEQHTRRPPGRIEVLGRKQLAAHLREVARDLFPDRVVDDLEVGHLTHVLTECALLLGDVYSDDRIARVVRPGPGVPGHLLDALPEAPEDDDVLLRVRRLPDDLRVLADKALFDHGLLGLRRVKGYDLADLGEQAYRRAAELLTLLAEDRRLQRFFRENRLLVLPLEEEVGFLKQCSDKFRLYADILRHTHGAGEGPAEPSVADVATRVPLMAAVVEALSGENAPTEEPSSGVEPDDDAYVKAARGERADEKHLTKEQLLAGYERVLLFSALDIPRLEAALNATVVDQQQAVSQLSDDFSLFATGTRNPHRPPSYFLVGPTGVGKNYLVESLARLLEGLWEIEIPLLTIEGPNYTYPSDINELRGATRGFIRSDEEGLLTTFHAKSSPAPLGVILVDEVEKAHTQLLTFFLSILDRGTTTDNRGKVLDFANCMIFFTSNLGYSDAQQETRPIGYLDEEARRRRSDAAVRRDLRGSLSPELVNRMRTIHFNRLERSSAERILDLELQRIARRYRQLHGLTIELAPSAREEILLRGFSPTFGARHLASTLEGVCNVDIAKKLRRDDRGNPGGRRRLIRWLREMRTGERAFSAEEVRRRVLARTRALLDYDTLRIEFRDGSFELVAEQRS